MLSPTPDARADAAPEDPSAGALPDVSSGAPPTPDVLALPALANTPDGDRELLREVGDGHVHVAAPAPPARPATASASTALPASPAGAAGPATASSTPIVAGLVGPPGASGPGTGPVASGPSAAPATTAPAGVPDVGADDAPIADPWSRIRTSTRLPGRIDVPAVAALREEYIAESPWVTRILERATPWIEHLVDELDRRFLPLGLAVLPAVESGFRPEARSTGSAAGLWQIVPITADEIGLERSVWFDARADILASTTAALDYLSYLNAEFDGDWELTLAAYNAGPGRVRAAMREAAAAGGLADFWSLRLPAETRRYVPKVLALVSLLRESPSPILVPDAAGGGFERVDVGLRISLDRAAALSGIPEEELRRFNAGLVHGVTAPEGPHALYLPRGTAEAFLASVAGADRDSLYSLPLVHEVVAGDTLSDIAHRYGITQAQLASMNALDGTAVYAGQKLAVIDVRRAGLVDVAYTVSAGDTLSGIAESHAVGVDDITRADGSPLDGDVIRPGEALSIVVGGRDGAG